MGDEAWGTIDARPIVFPAVVGEMNSVRADFLAPLGAVAEFVPDVLAVDEIGSGTAFVSFILTHYVRADWGSFARASVVTSVRPRGPRPDEPGLYTCIGATSARFPNEVLYWALGMHHVDAAVDVAYRGDEMTICLAAGRTDPLRVTAPLCDRPPVEVMTTGNVAYSVREDEVLRTNYEVSTGAGAVDATAVSFEPGGGRLGRAMRGLGMSAASASWYSGRGMRMVLHEPSPDLGGAGPVLGPMTTPTSAGTIPRAPT